ncbi:MAG: cryptochrome/photolyase family protein [Pseudomonadota bacterium]
MNHNGQPLFVIFGHQLFDPEQLAPHRDALFFLCESHDKAQRFRHHQQKLALMFSAMRTYDAELRAAGLQTTYHSLDDPQPFFSTLEKVARTSNCSMLLAFDPVNHALKRKLEGLAKNLKIPLDIKPSPNFLLDDTELGRFFEGNAKPQMGRFYKQQRRNLGLLLESDGQPRGGRWSLDSENRKRLPKNISPPLPPPFEPSAITQEVATMVAHEFAEHPGDAKRLWLPVDRKGAEIWFENFLAHRFHQFGPFEDAITTRSHHVFHSIISPLLNLGLLSPDAVLARAIKFGAENQVPLNSVEGFVRQVIGWREFIRGIYIFHSDRQRKSNHWGHTRGLSSAWYRGETGLDPLDHAIRGAIDHGWNHHIERLMVIGNLMTLCEIRPADAYRWFMEMYVDAYPWVMEPNVYGMALFSDGGIFATKPYLCASNYLLKMSDHKKGEWCEVLDGLYWRFVNKHRDYLRNNARMPFVIKNLEKIETSRLNRLIKKAESFIEANTD